MLIHIVCMTLATAGLTLCTFMPFLPGRYDSLAIPLSVMSQIAGKGGFLPVPVGVAWIASTYSNGRTGRGRPFAVAALAVSSFLWLVVSLVALVTGGFYLSLGTFMVGVVVVVRLLSRLRQRPDATMETARAMPIYLIVIPVAVTVLQMVLADPATEFSRTRVIRNSGQLIADIEQYRSAHGRYPTSLLSVWEDYSPSVIGVDRFHDEPAGDSYNVVFEHLSFRLGTREFVVYNPRDEQVMTSHNMDLLQ